MILNHLNHVRQLGNTGPGLRQCQYPYHMANHSATGDARAHITSISTRNLTGHNYINVVWRVAHFHFSEFPFKTQR